MFEEFITQWVTVIKSEPKEITFLSSEALVSATKNVLSTLQGKGMKFLSTSHLLSKKDFDWKEIPETYSFFFGKWYLNTSSNGSVYVKYKWRTDTIARVNSDTGMIEFNNKGKQLLPSIISEQSATLVPKQ